MTSIKNRKVQEIVKTSGGLYLLVDLLRNQDDKTVISALSTIIAAIEDSKFSLENSQKIPRNNKFQVFHFFR